MIWIVGCKGMLGQEFVHQLTRRRYKFIATDMDLDITDVMQVDELFHKIKIDTVINCSAYNFVDLAETEREKAYQVNVTGIRNICYLAVENKAKVIHFSSDYIFDGESHEPYVEEDYTCPLSQYGVTKALSEAYARNMLKEHFIFRVSWLYGPHKDNFVSKVLQKKELSIVNDQIGSPTYTVPLVHNIIDKVISNDSDKYGTYHYQDKGELSWYGFAKETHRLGKKYGIIKEQTKIKAIKTSDWKCSAKRPSYSVFDTSKVKNELKFSINNWKENLEEYIRRLSNERPKTENRK